MIVNLEREDSMSLEDHNASAVVAFARTRYLADVRIMQDCQLGQEMLRSGSWLEDLRKKVARTEGWALEHVTFMQEDP